MRKSRLSQHKQYKLIELFVAGVTARTAAELVNINKTKRPQPTTFLTDLSKQPASGDV